VTAWREERLGAEVARWLVGDDAMPWVAFTRESLAGGRDELAVASLLALRGLDVARRAGLLDVVAGSRRAHAAGMPAHTWWTTAAWEQASAPALSAWRAQRFTGEDVIDVTAGCGGDALALAATARTLVAIEAHPARAVLLAANLGTVATVRCEDALAVDVGERWVWADPGRRRDGRRSRSLAETVPPVPALLDACRGATGIGVALSPAVDLADPDLPADAELEFAQVGERLVEATLWVGGVCERGPGGIAPRSATLLPAGVHVRGEPGPPGVVGELGAWLVEPQPALVRARLHDRLAGEAGLRRFDGRRALFTGDEPPPASPWWRAWQIESVVPAHPKAVREALRSLEPLPLEIAVHGLDADPVRWLRDLGAPPTGPRGRRLHLVRTDAGGLAILSLSDARWHDER
jgi:hypothetical protein